MLVEALGCIITKSNFCFLCYRSVEHDTLVNVEDEVNIELIKSIEDLPLSKILHRVLGAEIVEYLSTFTTLCIDCTKSLVDNYRFIKNSIEQVKYLNNALDSLINVFEYTEEKENCKSVYVALNLNDFTNKIYYDSCPPPTSNKQSLQQFYALDKLEVKPKIENGDNKPVICKKNEIYSMRLVDMLDDTSANGLKCKVCGSKHASIKTLRFHFIKAHIKDGFKCDQCSRIYISQAILDEHIEESHCEVICSQCGKMFNSLYSLRHHEFSRHISIVCRDCGRSYKSQTTFKKHKEHNVCGNKVRASPINAKYTCDYCNKKYTQKVSLRVHIQYEHGDYKAQVCEWCGKKFWAKSRLKAHIVKHTKERNFHCKLCGGSFVSKESLLYHTRRHTGERPYECPYCDSKFLSSSRKVDHIKRAHKNSEYECSLCKSKFGSMFYLQKHIKRHSSQISSVDTEYDPKEVTFCAINLRQN